MNTTTATAYADMIETARTLDARTATWIKGLDDTTLAFVARNGSGEVPANVIAYATFTKIQRRWAKIA